MTPYKLLAAVAAAALLPSAGNAAITISIAQIGGNVVSTLSGTLDTTGLAQQFSNVSNNTGVRGSPFFAGFGSNGFGLIGYSGFSGPSDAGDGTDVFAAATSTGSQFAFNAGSFGPPIVFLASDFVSGGALEGVSTYAGQTLASIGLDAGTYVYRSSADTITVTIGSAVPEPATWATMIAGVGLAGGMLRRRRGAVRTTVRYA